MPRRFTLEWKQDFVASYFRTRKSMAKFCLNKPVAANTLSNWTRDPKVNLALTDADAGKVRPKPGTARADADADTPAPVTFEYPGNVDLSTSDLLARKEMTHLKTQVQMYKEQAVYWADQYTQLARAHAAKVG